MANNIFEQIKKINGYGQEYWSARDLMTPLGYVRWENFEVAIARAKESCKNSSQKVDDHFAGATKMVQIGSGTERSIDEYNLSRYACYLIAQNGDPRKEEIALAQTYFAIQTRKQEVQIYMNSEELAANLFRATQAEAKLKRENILGQHKANQAHLEVGKKVRKTIKELGGTMPENLPTPDNIKESKKRLKSSTKKSLRDKR